MEQNVERNESWSWLIYIKAPQKNSSIGKFTAFKKTKNFGINWEQRIVDNFVFFHAFFIQCQSIVFVGPDLIWVEKTIKQTKQNHRVYCRLLAVLHTIFPFSETITSILTELFPHLSTHVSFFGLNKLLIRLLVLQKEHQQRQ